MDMPIDWQGGIMEYICEDCGNKFDKPHIYYERHGSTCYKEYVEDEIECDGRCLNCDYYDTDDCPDRH